MCVPASVERQIGGEHLTRRDGSNVVLLKNTWPVFTEITTGEVAITFTSWKKENAAGLFHQTKISNRPVLTPIGGEF